MSEFLTGLNLDFHDTRDRTKRFQLGKPLRYLRTRKKGKFIDTDYYGVITVPVGEYTDFASVPWGFRWIISPIGLYGKAAVLHDYLCRAIRIGLNDGYLYGKVSGFSEKITREEADIIFLEAMESLGVGRLKRTVMYNAVRLYTYVSGGNNEKIR